MEYDIIIIGAGCAGLTAAIYARRAGKRVLVIEGESIGGQISRSPRVENYPGIKQISGIEFSDSLYEQAESLGSELEFTTVTAIRDEGRLKRVITEDGDFSCRALIIASGVKHSTLGIEREEELSGISYCAICDGAFYKNADVAVVGGGSSALQSAELLAATCRSVTLIHRRAEFRGELQIVERLKRLDNVSLCLDSVIASLNGEEKLSSVSIKNIKTEAVSELKVDGLFVAVGQRPNNSAFADTVELDESGYIIASEDCRASCQGIFAAGDCRTKAVRQLTTAAADGAVAALAACSYCDKQN